MFEFELKCGTPNQFLSSPASSSSTCTRWAATSRGETTHADGDRRIIWARCRRRGVPPRPPSPSSELHRARARARCRCPGACHLPIGTREPAAGRACPSVTPLGLSPVAVRCHPRACSTTRQQPHHRPGRLGVVAPTGHGLILRLSQRFLIQSAGGGGARSELWEANPIIDGSQSLPSL